jgi:hypothetical protein
MWLNPNYYPARLCAEFNGGTEADWNSDEARAACTKFVPPSRPLTVYNGEKFDESPNEPSGRICMLTAAQIAEIHERNARCMPVPARPLTTAHVFSIMAGCYPV